MRVLHFGHYFSHKEGGGLTYIRVSTTPGNPGNLLEFENPPGNPGNLESNWSSWKFLCNDRKLVDGFTT